jgi:hypothetical protein
MAGSGIFALGMLLAAIDPRPAEAPSASLSDVPAVGLESSYFARPDASARVFTSVLRVTGDAGLDDLSYQLVVGTMALFERGGERKRRSTTAGPANVALGGSYRSAFGARLSGQAGVLVMIGTTAIQPSAQRRSARSAYSHAIAMHGAWDAWLWAPEGGAGFVFPARLVHRHALGRWNGRAQLETALAFSLLADPRQTSLGRVLQVGLGYDVQPGRWLAVGTQARLVWMPTAQLYATQSSLVPYLWLGIGRWRLGGDFVFDLDAPYGWFGGGQRMWAAEVKLALSL